MVRVTGIKMAKRAKFGRLGLGSPVGFGLGIQGRLIFL